VPVSLFADRIADDALAPARRRYRIWQSELEGVANGDVIQLEADSPEVWGLTLPEAKARNMAYAGWISSRIRAWQREVADGTEVAVLIGEDFVSVEQFSLAHAAFPPMIVSQGPSAQQAAAAALEADRTFDPDAFDSDGYAI
jgi:hypothetical protein